jgi:hypothetical protein
MVKNASLTYSELVDVLASAKTPKERNKAVKLLKQFDPIEHKHLDVEAKQDKLSVKKYNYLAAFVCWRCGNVKQTNTWARFSTSEGVQKICQSCHSVLLGTIEVAQLKHQNEKAGLLPKIPFM